MKYKILLNKLWTTLFSIPIVKNLWAKFYKAKEFYNIPWTKLKKPLPISKIALISTGGVFLKNDHPFDLNNPNGDTSFRRIPQDVKAEELSISHKYYNHKDADKDPNLILPFEALNELQKEGVVGPSNSFHYSFMGHIKEPLVNHLIKNSAVKVANELKCQNVDIAFLVPA